MLTRLYECCSGCVEIDGINVKDWNIKSLRRVIGIVQQEPTLFNGTIFENIIMGDLTISIDKVEEICEMANAHNFIQKLPEVNFYFKHILSKEYIEYLTFNDSCPDISSLGHEMSQRRTVPKTKCPGTRRF